MRFLAGLLLAAAGIAATARGAHAVVSGQCVQARGGNSCTAGDVTFVLVGLGTQTTGCVTNSGNVTMYLGATLSNTAANTRYDIGMYINTDNSGSAYSGTTCAREILKPVYMTTGTSTCPPLNLSGGSGPYLNADGNNCGDLAKTGTLGTCSGGGGDSFFVFASPITFPCSDLNPRTGFIQIPTCATWGNHVDEVPGSTATPPSCTGGTATTGCQSECDVVPGTGSKCNCAVIQSNVPNPNLGLTCSCSPTPVRQGASTACTVSFTNTFSPACTNPSPTPAERFQCGVASFVRWKALYSTANGGSVLVDSGVTPSETTGGTVADDGAGTVTWTPKDTTASGTSLGVIGANESGSMTYQYIVGATQPDGVVNQTVQTYWSNGSGFSPEVQETALSATCTFTVSSTANWASVHSVKAREEAGRVVLGWETAAEIATAGFRVLRQEPSRSGRPGEFRAVSSRLLPAVGRAPGGVYRFVDDTAPATGRLTYKIVERDLRGGEHESGPFTVEVERRPEPPAVRAMAADFEAAAHPPRLAASPGPPAAIAPPASASTAGAAPGVQTTVQSAGTGAATRLKIATSAPGLYSVGAADVAAAFGGSPSSVVAQIARGRYRLSNRGSDVAWQPAADGKGIVFYAAPVDKSLSLFNLRNVYWLEGGTGTAIGAAAGGGGSAPAPAGQSFLDAEHFKQSLFANPYVTANPADDYWFWQAFLSGDPQLGQGSFSVNLPGVAAGASGASLAVNLMGFSSSHRVSVQLNGTALGEIDWTWDGAGFGARHSGTFTVAPGQLVAGVNRIDLVGLDGIFFLDSFDVIYPRLYRAAGDQLAFHGDANPVVTVGGFSRSDVAVYDLSLPLSPRLAAGVVDADPAGGFRVSFRPASASTPYLAASGAAVAAASSTPRTDAGLASARNGADYLVVTAGSLRAAAQGLADYRKSRGLVTQVVTVDDVMDDFAYGLLDPGAIRAFVAYAAANWQPRPRYLAFAGKGTYDYRGLLGFGDNLVPPMMVASYEGLVPSDGAFADLDGDGIADLAVGRIPALTAAELTAYLGKVQAYESGGAGSWAQRVLLAADAPDAAGDYVQGSDAVASRVPAGFQIDRDYLTAGATQAQLDAARAQLLGGFAGGRVLVNYVGHGGLDRLASAGLLTTADVGLLSGGPRSPLLTALT
ncbi:MAG TPA: C25 family cysteine peptidase, partial [Thermoanaerobaculia bacterium]|nr:C25 family cysteine peptidase [Thermoanaerobaculia bacterium]